MNAEIVAIGTELLLGEIVDTNTPFIARSLAELGVDVYNTSTVGDNPERLRQMLGSALTRADVVVTTGGLGPTADDVTREAVASLFSRELVLREDVLEEIVRIFRSRGRQVPESNRRQAMVPKGACIVPNPVGTAPGLLLVEDGRTVVCLPGVPYEMEVMWKESVIPYLEERLGREHAVITSRTLRIRGVGESSVEEQLKPIFESQRNPTISTCARRGEVLLRLTAKGEPERAEDMLDDMESRVRRIIGGFVEEGADEPEKEVSALLRERGLTVAVAESCTGGLLSRMLTEMAGSSGYFERGLVCYSNRAKTELLGVPASVITSQGAVSEEVARLMARQVRVLSGTELGLSTTGIAGPGGGTDEKPVGLTYIAVAGPLDIVAERHVFRGGRSENRHATSMACLRLLVDSVRGGRVIRCG